MEHKCGRATANKQVTSSSIARQYLEFFRDDPTMKIEVLKLMIHRDLTADVEKMTLYRARSIALDEIEGKHLEQFGKIRDHAKQIMDTTLEVLQWLM